MTKAPQIESLRLFIAAAEFGSIGAAARDARISQPAASTRIVDLERDLGVQLLTRTPSGSRLTDAGQLVSEWARDVLRSVDELSRGVESLRRTASPTLRVAASQTIAEFLIPRWLTALRVEYPQISVQLTACNSARVVDQVRSNDVDLGFIETPRVPRDVRSAVVGRDELVLVGAPGTQSRTYQAKDLAELALITREVGSGTRDTLERAIGELSKQATEQSSNSAVKLAVMSGAGLAVLSRLAVNAEIADGRLIELPLRALNLQRTLRAVVRRDAPGDDRRDRLVAIARRQSRYGQRSAAG